MTLLETSIAFGIISTLALACFSTYGSYHQNKELELCAQGFIRDINYAKEISTITGKTVYLCASLNHHSCSSTWSGDLITFSSDSPQEIQTILKIAPPLPKDITFKTDLGGFTQNDYLRFMNNGELVNAGKFSFSIGTHSQEFKISTTGIVSEAS